MGHTRNKAELKKSFKEKKKLKSKARKKELQLKRAKLAVKNLPFQVTEENLKKHFETFGKVLNVQLLKKEDGKLLGFAFVQFEAVQKAAKARHHLNNKPFLGRSIECDFAMPKKQYMQKVAQEKRQKLLSKEEIKDEPIDSDEIKQEIKDEPLDLDIDNIETKDEIEIKDDSSDSEDDENVKENETNAGEISESKDSDSDIEEIKESVLSNRENTKFIEKDEKFNKKEKDKDSDLDEVESNDEEESDDDDDDDDSGVVDIDEASQKKPKMESHDISEGKTVFIKNVPFDATNQDLKECMLQFGPVYYALICIDRLTEHSKGTAFVKFREKVDAEKCLQAGTELKLLDNILDCHPALERNEINKKAQEKEANKLRDSRNLYLIKEGVIMAGSKAAEGVSASDMAKRLQIEQHKSQMLRNLNMFISKSRLIVHNLPTTWDDAKLKALCKKHAGPGAVIKEAKIMRNMKVVDSNGVGTSKEFGFVTFSTHEHALNTLRSLNNNPNVFSAGKRPIVGFSIENRKMVNAKQKRAENSRKLNPKSNEFDAKIKEEQKNHQRQGKNEKVTRVIEGDEFSGLASKPGGPIQKMRNRQKLKTQAQVHHQQLKAEKLKRKNLHSKKSLEQKKEGFIRQDAQKVNRKKQGKNMQDDNFSKMVNSYKMKLLNANIGKSNGDNSQRKGKWFEET